MQRKLTRRQALKAGGAGLGAATVLSNELVAKALAWAPPCGKLTDIQHVVFLIQENRSFDHYYGSYKGVRGFADPRAKPGVFAQPGYPAPGYGGHLRPFHLDSSNNGECTHDITHAWGPQHRSWDGGKLDGFVTEHLKTDGASAGPLTMGYYTRPDLPLHYALADAFTLCDNYYCSVIGPSDPNHLMSISGTIDPDGLNGGPLVETLSEPQRHQNYGKYTWPTMPERLQANGISWKVYSGDNFSPVADPVFTYFKNYLTDPNLNSRALVPAFPSDFLADVAAGQLPQVSWIYTFAAQSEHPPTPPDYGEVAISQILNALVSNPSLWASTVFFITYDENGGFFDHVPPPVPPAGTPGEFLTVANLPPAAEGIRGPIGLGFRVPLLIVSPFSRGGFVSSNRFDHTSMLRFLETRFGVAVPNLSSWRRSVTGDLTSALNFRAPNTNVPALPQPPVLDPKVFVGNCAPQAVALGAGQLPVDQFQAAINQVAANYPVPPPPQRQPGQEAGRAVRPSGRC
jgi:phospholipase C